jgi:diguanylate cyclase (GGDEF)-like protein
METILVVDDTKTNIQIVMQLLGDRYNIMAAKDGLRALQIAQEESPDLILLDIMMPGMDGFEVCQRLKENNTTQDIPIIFLTAQTDENSIEKAYDIGGSDYVTKPFRPKELLARVKRELKLVKLQNELKELASVDPMTKLYNRRYFTKTSKQILKLAHRDKTELSLIMIDIDKFKNINDTYGHAVGDEVLIKFADILKESQRKSDIVCRFGGEEFVILLPETNIEGAENVAQKIREKTQATILDISDTTLSFTASLGVSCVQINSEKNIEAALNRADEALYEAKNSGRNKVIIKGTSKT